MVNWFFFFVSVANISLATYLFADRGFSLTALAVAIIGVAGVVKNVALIVHELGENPNNRAHLKKEARKD